LEDSLDILHLLAVERTLGPYRIANYLADLFHLHPQLFLLAEHQLRTRGMRDGHVGEPRARRRHP